MHVNGHGEGMDYRDKCNLDRAWLMGSTPVLIKNGPPEKIQYLQLGQEVLSHCEQTGEIGFRKITHIFVQEDVPTYLLYYGGYSAENANDFELRSIEAEPSLALFVLNKGWTLLRNLLAGDVVKSFDLTCFSPGTCIADSFSCAKQTVLGIAPSGLNRKVFSLALEDFDTYFVREEGFLVLEQTNGRLMLEKRSSDHDATRHSNIGGFPSDALVSIKGGHKSEMQFIMPGTEVLSRCVTTGDLRYRKVLRRIVHESMPAYYLGYDFYGQNQGVVAAIGQQFFVSGSGWTNLSEIKIGDLLEVNDGSTISVKILKKEVDEQEHYFNYCMLEIEGSDSYCVNDGLYVRGFALNFPS